MSAYFDVARIHSVLEDFYNLTGFRIGVYNARFEKIVEYPQEHCAFCTQVRQKARQLCRQSDARHSRLAAAQQLLYTYRCPAGLTETLAPICYGKTVLGYLMIGQLRTEEAESNAAEWEQLAALGVDTAALRQTYRQMPITQPKRAAAAVHILQTCAAHLWLEKMVMQNRSQLHVRLQDYLYLNYARPLTVDIICSEMGVGKTTLAAAARNNLGAGIAALLTRRRVEEAQRLLLQTDWPVNHIAEAVGIPDSNYFTKIFRRHTGSTPRDYRKNSGSTQ